MPEREKLSTSLRFPRYRGEDIVIPGISRCFRKEEALGPAFLVSQVGRGNEGGATKKGGKLQTKVVEE